MGALTEKGLEYPTKKAENVSTVPPRKERVLADCLHLSRYSILITVKLHVRL